MLCIVKFQIVIRKSQLRVFCDRLLSADDLAHVKKIHLPAIAAMCRVHGHQLAIRAETRMQIASPLSNVWFRGVEVAQGHTFVGGNVIEVGMLDLILIGIGILIAR